MNASSFWDREVAHPQHSSWLEHPTIHEYANRLIGNGSAIWPVDWFQEWLAGRRFETALSVGCGSGPMERDLIRHDLVGRIDAFDQSVSSLALARSEATRAGLAARINYFAADFNRPALPRRRYDLVVFHQSAHHVQELEKLFRAVLIALKPTGILYLDEYVGPSRFDWSVELLANQDAVYATLPRPVRSEETLSLPIQEDDPSEALRSSEIETLLSAGFETAERRPYGGTLLSVIYPKLRPESLTDELVDFLLGEEQRLLASGAPSFYAVIVARPFRGLRNIWAQLHYLLAPKVKELLVEVSRRLGRRVLDPGNDRRRSA
jgi:SAM-dependent methyltransferase